MWWANTGMVEKAVASVVEAEPDAMLLGADFACSHTPDVGAQVGEVMRLLEPLTSAEMPVYAVMGNHDHEVGAVPEPTEALSSGTG